MKRTQPNTRLRNKVFSASLLSSAATLGSLDLARSGDDLPMHARTVTLFRKNKLYYALIFPGVLYFLIFHYTPMYGIIIAFKDIAPFDGLQGIFSAEWVGLKHIRNFIGSYYFWDIIGNTLIISFYRLIFGFPAPIVLALLMNEVGSIMFKRTVQTISYLPHFLSMVVVAGLATTLLTTDGGFVNNLLQKLGFQPIMFLSSTDYFRSVLVVTGIWKEIGWGTIIYLAAITGVDSQLYEAARVDGANRMRQIWHITLPGIRHIVVILFILSIGGIMNAGFEQVFLLYSPPVYEVADIIDTYVYRKGLVEMQYSFAAAIELFKSVIAVVLILSANYMAKKLDQEGIW
ncbi:ABC transporter permease [Paenibacillus eucommiae]|uniref:Aldouronate transport system permease protein n=1 Tax=Paenibacillus eucommiae TaxID=1355755 RepID=A0ABS4J8W6_9BACL|nr:ABC transporter permease subunit [Paenibacillus eucommiae]MBP1996288.1 putative aldouronate transport system permease protein [Paenibacillus eucommiae]